MDAILLGGIIPGGLVIGAAVVPDHDVADAPFVPVLAVRLDHIPRQFLDQIVALVLFHTLDEHDLTGIEIERLAPAFAVGTDNGVEDRLPVAVLGVQQRLIALAPAIGEAADHAFQPLFQPLR